MRSGAKGSATPLAKTLFKKSISEAEASVKYVASVIIYVRLNCCSKTLTSFVVGEHIIIKIACDYDVWNDTCYVHRQYFPES